MADAKLNELTALAGASLAAGDEFYLNDVSAATSKKTTLSDLSTGLFLALGVQSTPPGAGVIKMEEYFGTLVLSKAGPPAMNMRCGPADFAVPATCGIGWAVDSLSAAGGGSDTTLYREALGVIAQQHGTDPQKYKLYVTFTSLTNAEWLEMGSASGVPYIQSKKGSGGGTQRALNLGAGGNHLNIGTDGVTTVAAATATPAGGSTAARLLFGTTAGFGIYFGSGVPTVLAGQGSLYMRSDGNSASTRMYINSTGSTVWVPVTTGS